MRLLLFRDCSNSTPKASTGPEALEGDRTIRVGGIGPVWGRRRQAGSREIANLRGGEAGPGCLGPERSGGSQAAKASTFRRELPCFLPRPPQEFPGTSDGWTKPTLGGRTTSTIPIRFPGAEAAEGQLHHRCHPARTLRVPFEMGAYRSFVPPTTLLVQLNKLLQRNKKCPI